MGSPAPGFRVVWDVLPLDARWVLLPGVLALGACLALLLLRRRARGPRTRVHALLGAAALGLFLASVWWTVGGVGAWRAGAARLQSGTANFAEGALSAPVRATDGTLLSFEVAGQRFHRAPDAAFPALHATRWPTVLLADGQRVRVWFFADDVLRLEAATSP